MASGIISPSELPDSPSQTVPSSPKRVRHIQSSGAPHLQVQKLIHPPAGKFCHIIIMFFQTK